MAAGISAAGASRRNAGLHSWAASNARSEAVFSSQQEDANANAEVIAGAQAALDLRETLQRTIGQQRVAFAASGVDPLSGTPAHREDAMEQRTGEDLELTRSQTEINRLQRIIRASQIRMQGIYQGFRSDAAATEAEAAASSRMTSALADAAGSVFKYKADEARRGA
jgi:hypothetical protein